MKKAVTRSVFGLFLLGLGACKDPNAVSRPAPDAEVLFASASAPTASASAPTASASAPTASAVTTAASAAPGTQCASDADCRTHASYCQETPCACQVLGKGDAETKCSGTPVACLVNPCARKAAACQNGKCELVVKSN